MPTITSFVQFIFGRSYYDLFTETKTGKYFKEFIFNTLLFADDQFIISDTRDNLQKAVYLLYNLSKQNLRGFSPRANHTDRAAAAGRRS